jgi:Mrp family chromosome partitioning ATPase
VSFVLLVTLATTTSVAILVCLIELLFGRHVRPVSHSLAPGVPTDLSTGTLPVWISAPTTEPSCQRGLAVLIEHVRRRGSGIHVVTTSDADERAKLAAIELAREIGYEDARVLFLDCKVPGTSAGSPPDRAAAGFADVLFGVASFGEVIQRDPESRIHVIPVGRGIRDTAALMAGGRLGIILGALAQTYDYVVLFVPYLATIEGGARLARFSRSVVLVAGEGKESESAATFDALAARGFTNVAVATVGKEIRTASLPRAAA